MIMKKFIEIIEPNGEKQIVSAELVKQIRQTPEGVFVDIAWSEYDVKSHKAVETYEHLKNYLITSCDD